MLHHMFIFGVLIPTIVTVLVFIGFLICWFKFNMAQRVFKKSYCKKNTEEGLIQNTSVLSETDPMQADISTSSKADNFHHDDPGDNATGVSSKPDTLLSENRNQLIYSGEDDDPLNDSFSSQNSIKGINQCYENPNLTLSPTDVKVLTQHTFHFSRSDFAHIDSPGQDTDDLSGEEDEINEDDYEANYSDFIPLSEALKNAKTRQILEDHMKHSKSSGACTDKLLSNMNTKVVIETI